MDWLSFLSGVVGAVVGASASLAGVWLTGQQSREVRKETENLRRQTEVYGALASVFSLTWEISSKEVFAGDARKENFSQVRGRWTEMRERLAAVGLMFSIETWQGVIDLVTAVETLLDETQKLVDMPDELDPEKVEEYKTQLEKAAEEQRLLVKKWVSVHLEMKDTFEAPS